MPEKRRQYEQEVQGRERFRLFGESGRSIARLPAIWISAPSAPWVIGCEDCAQ